MDALTVATPDKQRERNRATGLRLALIAGAGAFVALFPWLFARVDETLAGSAAAYQRQALYFFATLLLVVAVLHAPSVASRLERWGRAFAAWLVARGAFAADAQTETPKFALLRITFGALLTQRAFLQLLYLPPSDLHNAPVVVLLAAKLVAGLCVMAGLFTQYVLLYLIFCQWQFGDILVGTRTLGNDIASMLGWFLILTNAGAHLSADAWLRRRRGGIARVVRFGYYADGMASTEGVLIAKFLMLASYWCVCLYSLMMHLSEPAWMTGVAGPQLLTNNFMSRLAAEFAIVFEYSGLAVRLARISLYVMMAWYLLLLPFVLLGGIARKAVIVWGLLFFALSTFVLQLGWLGYFEFIIWAALFWTKRFIARPRSFALAYDDRCNLCDRTVSFLCRVDIFRQLALRPLSQNIDWLAAHGISQQQASTDLFAVDEAGRSYSGYGLYIELARRLLLLLPLYPLLLLGQFLRIGPAIYRKIADRRIALFGVCQIATPKRIHAYGGEGTRSLSRGDPIFAVATHAFALAICFLLATPAPFANWSGVPLPDAVDPITDELALAAHYYGITEINVFNRTDLRMAENWFVLEAVNPDGSQVVLPMTSEQGTRLYWHNSDRLYFGATLLWRRANIGTTSCLFEQTKPLLLRLVSLYAWSAPVQPSYYLYRQYQQPIPEPAPLLHGKYVSFPAQLLCQRSFTPGG